MKAFLLTTTVILFFIGSACSEQVRSEKQTNITQKSVKMQESKKIIKDIIIGDWSISPSDFEKARKGTAGLCFLTNGEYTSILFNNGKIRENRSARGRWKIKGIYLTLIERGHKSEAKLIISNNMNIILEFKKHKMYLHKRELKKGKK